MPIVSRPNSITFRALYRHVFFSSSNKGTHRTKVANNMQLANIASLIYRHPMSTHVLRAIFHHFLNALLKSGCRFKAAQTNTHCYSSLHELCKQDNQKVGHTGILKNFECKGKNRSKSHTDLNVLSPRTLILFKKPLCILPIKRNTPYILTKLKGF